VAGLFSLEIRGNKFPPRTKREKSKMKFTFWCMSIVTVCMLVLIATEDMAPGRATQSAKPAGCSAPEYRQVDFWAGGCPRPS